VRFDGSDLLPPWLGTYPIWKAMTDYLRAGPDSRAAVVAAKPEHEEPLEADRGGAVGEPELVGGDAAEAHAPVAAPNEPGDGAFDHGPVSAVALLPVRVARGGAGGGVGVVVAMDLADLAAFAGGAPLTQRTVVAAGGEPGCSGRADRHGLAGGGGRGLCGGVDGEVGDGERCPSLPS
jgi:hypothetical protein